MNENKEKELNKQIKLQRKYEEKLNQKNGVIWKKNSNKQYTKQRNIRDDNRYELKKMIRQNWIQHGTITYVWIKNKDYTKINDSTMQKKKCPLEMSSLSILC